MIHNYDSLPIGKHIDIIDIANRDGLEDIEKQVAILSILTDKSEDVLLDLPIAEYSEMAKQAKFLEDMPAKQDGRRIAGTYRLGNLTLVPVKDIGRMTTAQYIDFQTYTQDTMRNLPQILSCLLIPQGKKYNTDYDIIEVQDAIRTHLSVTDCNRLSAFFLRRWRISIKGMLIYSRWQIKRVKDKSKRAQLMQEAQKVATLLSALGDGSQM